MEHRNSNQNYGQEHKFSFAVIFACRESILMSIFRLRGTNKNGKLKKEQNDIFQNTAARSIII